MSNHLNADSATISIIIPVYNEGKTIIDQLQYLSEHSRNFPTEIIVADGGSTDSTALKVKEEGVTTMPPI